MLGTFEQRTFSYSDVLSKATALAPTPVADFTTSDADTQSETAPKRRSEEFLLALSRQGDIVAFGELIRRHYSACLKQASAMMRNRGDAEDEVQNACCKA